VHHVGVDTSPVENGMGVPTVNIKSEEYSSQHFESLSISTAKDSAQQAKIDLFKNHILVLPKHHSQWKE